MRASCPENGGATAFIFDIGGVLLDFDLEALTAAAAAGSTERLGRLMALRDAPSLREVETGMISGEEYFTRHIHPILPHWSYRDLIEAWKSVFTENRPGRKLLRDLRASGRRTYLLSNIAEFNIAAIAEKFPGVLEKSDGNFFSCRMGCWKPGREIYLRVCAEIGKKPSECIFLDDTPACVEGARVAGLRGILFSGERIAGIRRECGLSGAAP